MGHVLALVDGSAYSESVCDHAAWIAGGLRLPVTLLQVLDRRQVWGLPFGLGGAAQAGGTDKPLRDLIAPDPGRLRVVRERARAGLDALRARILQAGVPEVSTSLQHGDFVETFEADAAAAHIGVLGKRGESAASPRGSLGSNLERAMRASPVPLLVASRAFRPVHRIVVAFDGGPGAVKAVEHIAMSAVYDECAVTLLSVGLMGGEALRAREAALGLLVAHGHSPEAVEVGGDPASAVAEHLERNRADLLAMGAWGHSRLHAMVTGSTTSELLGAARVPVLLCR